MTNDLLIPSRAVFHGGDVSFELNDSRNLHQTTSKEVSAPWFHKLPGEEIAIDWSIVGMYVHTITDLLMQIVVNRKISSSIRFPLSKMPWLGFAIQNLGLPEPWTIEIVKHQGKNWNEKSGLSRKPPARGEFNQNHSPL